MKNIKKNALIIIILSVFIIAGALFYNSFHILKATQSTTNEIINQLQKKRELFTTMYIAARERSLLLANMLVENDPFLFDEYHTDFQNLAGIFINARLSLLEMDLNEKELELLNRQVEAAKQNAPILNQVAALIASERHIEANDLFYNKAIPGQKLLLEDLREISAQFDKVSLDFINQINQDFDENINNLITIALIMVSIIVVVLFILMTHLSRDEEKKLRQAMLKAEKANRVKSEFLSHMSHELRTPLNAVIGFSELISQNEELDEETKEEVGFIHDAGKHLVRLVNDILDLSRIESGKMDIEIEPVDLQSVIFESHTLIRPLAERHEVELDFEDTSGITLSANTIRVKQSLLNLLSNAIKYNSQPGKVTLSLSRPEPGLLRINISDTGEGIAPDQLDKLFSPFERLQQSSSHIQGAGIGLAITRQLVELMQGHVGVQSEPGKGTTFWIELQEIT